MKRKLKVIGGTLLMIGLWAPYCYYFIDPAAGAIVVLLGLAIGGYALVTGRSHLGPPGD
jgi:hypothetical protein